MLGAGVLLLALGIAVVFMVGILFPQAGANVARSVIGGGFQISDDGITVGAREKKLATLSELPTDFPAHVPLPESAQVKSISKQPRRAPTSYAISLHSFRDTETIAAFYERRLTKNGWRPEERMVYDQTHYYRAVYRGSDFMRVRITSQEAGAGVKITILRLEEYNGTARVDTF
jgi:hypothetical protein